MRYARQEAAMHERIFAGQRVSLRRREKSGSGSVLVPVVGAVLVVGTGCLALRTVSGTVLGAVFPAVL